MSECQNCIKLLRIERSLRARIQELKTGAGHGEDGEDDETTIALRAHEALGDLAQTLGAVTLGQMTRAIAHVAGVYIATQYDRDDRDAMAVRPDVLANLTSTAAESITNAIIMVVTSPPPPEGPHADGSKETTEGN